MNNVFWTAKYPEYGTFCWSAEASNAKEISASLKSHPAYPRYWFNIEGK